MEVNNIRVHDFMCPFYFTLFVADKQVATINDILLAVMTMKNNNSLKVYSVSARVLRALFAGGCLSLVLLYMTGCGQSLPSDSSLQLKTRYSEMGRNTLAGLGGELKKGQSRVVRVTNLNRDGEGSLSWALRLNQPRVVVFEVGGVIDLAGESITITEPYLTIAGQSAPEPGITIIRGGLSVRTHDVRIQHIRVRPGDNHQPKRSGWNTDGISVSGENAKDVHIDHVSVSWAVDENLSASGNRYKGYGFAAERVTFSHCLIAEALDYASHKKGKHSKGLLVHDFARDIGVINNVFAHNDRRNPYFKAHATGFVANNLIYNAGSAAVQVNFVEDEWVGQSIAPNVARITLVNNQLTYGVDSYSDLALLSSRGAAYLKGNRVLNLDGETMPITDGAIESLQQPPVWLVGYSTTPMKNLQEELISHAGATPWARDAVDKRIIESVVQRTGRIIDSQDEVGGYPNYPASHRKFVISDDKIADWLASF